LDDFVDHFLLTAASDEESSKRKLFPDALSSEHLSDFDRLLQLHSRRAYSDAANLSQQLLHGPSSHYAPVMKSLLLHNSSNHKDQTVLTLESQQQQVVQILMMHMQALLKTKQYSQLKHELDTWTFVYHHHHKSHQQQLPPKSNSSPSPLWVPWAVHIAVAASLQYTNLVSASTDDDNSQENEPTSTLWALHKHIVIPPDDFKSLMYLEQTLCNIFCRNKEWKMALVCLERILETILAKFDTTTTTNNNNNNNNQAMAKMTMMQTALTCDVLSRQGRILLQTGATQQAATLFQRAADLWKEGTTKTTTTTSTTTTVAADSDLPFDTATIPCQLLVNDGLIAFAQDKYEQALECFRKATLQLKAILKQQEPNTTSTTTSTSMDLWMASGFQWTLLETPYTLYSECVNNMALCAIYTVSNKVVEMRIGVDVHVGWLVG
jgi:tetratricopeptide (TPR) repeat protein